MNEDLPDVPNPDADPRAPKKFKYEKGRYIIPLKHPFDFGKDRYTELKLRRPKSKHMRKMKAEPDMNDMLRMLEVLSDESKHVIDELDPVDSGECIDFMSNFF